MFNHPAFTGFWVQPERLGFVRRNDLSTPQVVVYQAPNGKLKEFDGSKGNPMLFVDENVGIR